MGLVNQDTGRFFDRSVLKRRTAGLGGLVGLRPRIVVGDDELRRLRRAVRDKITTVLDLHRLPRAVALPHPLERRPLRQEIRRHIPLREHPIGNRHHVVRLDIEDIAGLMNPKALGNDPREIRRLVRGRERLHAHRQERRLALEDLEIGRFGDWKIWRFLLNVSVFH